MNIGFSDVLQEGAVENSKLLQTTTFGLTDQLEISWSKFEAPENISDIFRVLVVIQVLIFWLKLDAHWNIFLIV